MIINGIVSAGIRVTKVGLIISTFAERRYVYTLNIMLILSRYISRTFEVHVRTFREIVITKCLLRLDQWEGYL
jgi:hypothetical protein